MKCLLAYTMAFAMACTARSAGAQQQRGAGMEVALHAMGIFAANDSTGESFGAGAAGAVGVGLSRYLAAQFGVDLAVARDASYRLIGHADLALLVRDAHATGARPYAVLAFTSRGSGLAGDRLLLGTGAMVGAGITLASSARRRVDLALLYWHGHRDDLHGGTRSVIRGLATHGRSVRLLAGWRWTPTAQGAGARGQA